MAIKVTLPTAFVRHTEGKKAFGSSASNLPSLLTEIDQQFPALGTQIKDDSGRLRRFINIYVNDEDIRFLGGETYTFQDGDEVMLIPSIAGGSSDDLPSAETGVPTWSDLLACIGSCLRFSNRGPGCRLFYSSRFRSFDWRQATVCVLCLS